MVVGCIKKEGVKSKFWDVFKIILLKNAKNSIKRAIKLFLLDPKISNMCHATVNFAFKKKID